MEEVYHNYILTRTELEILLNRSGCVSLYGFFVNDGETISENEVYRAVVALFSKGLLSREDGKAVIQKEVSAILNHMNDAPVILNLTQVLPIHRKYICYIDEDAVVVTSCSETRENSVNLAAMSKTEFLEMFLRDLLPEENIAGKWSIEKIPNSEIEAQFLNIQNGLFSNEVILVCEFRKKEVIGSLYLCVMEYLLNQYMVYGDAEPIEIKEYTKETFLAMMRKE